MEEAGGDPAPPPVVAPVITQQPASQTVVAGGTASFSVALQDATGASYKWLREGATVAGATQSSHVFTAALADSGSRWTVRVSNAAGTVTSSEAMLNVTPKPADPSLGLSLFNGDIGGPGKIALSTSFGISPIHVAANASGTLFTINEFNGILQRILPDGQVQPVVSMYTIFRGSPGDFNSYRLAADDAGAVYFVRGGSSIYSVGPDGVLSTFAGSATAAGTVSFAGGAGAPPAVWLTGS